MIDGRIMWIGLDYAAVRAGLKGAGFKLTKTQWRGLTMMEREASDVLNGKKG